MSIIPLLFGEDVEKFSSINTQEETATEEVGDIYELLGVVTKSLFPSRATPDPYLPGANEAPSLKVPVLSCPLES